MVALLVSFACDRCASAPEIVSRGFAVLRPGAMLPLDMDLLATRDHAQRWRELDAGGIGEIIEVGAGHEIRWRPSQGPVRGLLMADHVYEVVDDPALAPRPNRAWRIG